MQEEDLSSFVAALWAAGLALPCSLEDTVKNGNATVADVATEAELVKAIADPHITTIILTNDIILLETLVVSRSNRITIDLGGHRVASLVVNSAAVQVQAGELVLAGKGSIVASREPANAIQIKGALTNDVSNYSSLFVGQRVALYAPGGCGVFVVPNFHAAYGVKVEIQGKIVARNGISVSTLISGEGENLAEIVIAAGAKVEADRTQGRILDVPESAAKVILKAGEYRGPALTDLAKYLAPDSEFKLSASGQIARVQPKVIPAQTKQGPDLDTAYERLRSLMSRAENYLDRTQIGHELGEWQSAANKATAAIRRALKTADKLLHDEKTTVEQVMHLIRRFRNTIESVEHIADEIRTETLSILATAEELEPKDYSIYSYGLLSEAMTSADILISQDNASLNELYSVFCDLRLNIDLLDDPDDESDFILPKPCLAKRFTPARQPKVEVTADRAAYDALANAQQNLCDMLNAVEDLTVNDYRPDAVEQFGELQVVIVKARTLLSKKDLTLPQIMDMMDEVKFATAGLQLEAADPDWSALRATVTKIAQLEVGAYTADSYQAVLDNLEQAKSLLNRTEITQAEIDNFVFELNLAVAALIPATPARVSQQFDLPPVQRKRKFISKSRLLARLFS